MTTYRISSSRNDQTFLQFVDRQFPPKDDEIVVTSPSIQEKRMHLIAAVRSFCVLILAGTFVSFVPHTESPQAEVADVVGHMADLSRDQREPLKDHAEQLTTVARDQSLRDQHAEWSQDSEELSAENEFLDEESPFAVKVRDDRVAQVDQGSAGKTTEKSIVLTASEENSLEVGKKKKEHVKAKVLLSVDKLPAGEKCQFVVILEVQEGWHINANPPSPENMIPTALTIKSKEGTKQLETKYPKGKKFVMEELPDPVSVYEGEVQIRGEIEAVKSAAGKKEELEFQVRYQACNDKNCLPPKTIKFNGAIEIVAPGTKVNPINAKYFPMK